MKSFEQLRREYPLFIYKDFKITEDCENIRLEYTFIQKKGSSDFITYHPTWTLPYSYAEYAKSPYREIMDKVIFYLGCTELISYWKSCCSPQVRIDCGAMSEYARNWFKKLYFNGLSEFFYRNQINTDIESFLSIQVKSAKETPRNTADLNGFLIPVGGGKDSVVTMELLKRHQACSKCFIINLDGAPLQTAKTAGFADKDIIKLTRTLDPGIIEMNRQGFLNGHTPFSAIVAFSAYLCALFEQKKYIVLSNESSANDVYVKGTEVNHQYSKSLTFENDFRAFAKTEFGKGPEYFSLLRPLNEWNIVKQFIRSPQYLQTFKSCNLGSKKNIWCGKCSKCLFVYIMLCPFVDEKILAEIFGKNLLDDEDMTEYFDGLVCENFDKPFECIGTREEINAALTAGLKKYERQNKKLPLLLQMYKDEYYDPMADFTAVDNFFDKNNNVPAFLKEELGWN